MRKRRTHKGGLIPIFTGILTILFQLHDNVPELTSWNSPEEFPKESKYLFLKRGAHHLLPVLTE